MKKSFQQVCLENRGLRSAHKKIKAERDALEWKLAKAVKYLKDAKTKFAPHTTNSEVDDFIGDK